jgi:hypothetical protein
MNFEDLQQFLNEKIGLRQVVPESEFEDVSVVMMVQ